MFVDYSHGNVPPLQSFVPSNDNPYSEAMFRTLKGRPNYPHNGFSTLEEARQWAAKFVFWYNEIHLHSGLKFVTPVQCHTGIHVDILKKRGEVYLAAKERNPERWSKEIRDWEPHKEVGLNPMRTEQELDVCGES